MRLHHLSIAAFGPFAERVDIDFDALSEASLFLLCGDTGAGKTTVLDAVCFALYGDVPSVRATARQLRSHHAAEGARPEVVLDASIAGRRLRFTRSPAWQRPKKRGTGLTTEQAHVLVEERASARGEWELRTNRLDEAGHLVTELLGMTLAQFAQVVLLPQNQFDRFLRSTSEDRQKVLTRLFRTARFEQVEQWFAERRRALHRRQREHEARVHGVLHRLSEIAGVPLPDDWTDSGLDAAAEDGRVPAWSRSLLVSAHDAVRLATAAEAAARAERDARRESVRAADRTRQLRERHARAVRTLAGLADTEDEAAADRDRLDTARRASRVLPWVEVATASEADADRARRMSRVAHDGAAAALGRAPEELLPEQVPTEGARAAEALATARAARPRAEERAAVAGDLERHRERIGQVSTALDRDRSALAELPAQEQALVDQLRVAREQAVLLGTRRQAVDRVGRQLEAARSVVRLTEQREAARSHHLEAREEVADLREELLQLRELRLTGMAAELASGLVVGAGCPVCGSAEHPAPARADRDAPSRSDEERVRTRLDDAEVVLTAAQDSLRGIESQLAAATAIADGESVTGLESALSELTEASAAAAAAQASVTGHEQQLSDLRARRAELAEQVTSARDDLAGCEEAAGRLGARLVELDEELAGILGDAPDLDAAIARARQVAEALHRADAARAEEVSATRRAASDVARATEHSRSEGFDGTDAVLEGVLDEEHCRSLEESLNRRLREDAEATETLHDEEVLAATRGDEPEDGASLAEALRAAESELDGAVAAARVTADRLAGLTDRTLELETCLDDWAPLRTEHRAVAALAELVEGKGPDNSRQMRLSAYVLSARLGQVVDAANERLVRMTDSRYLLEHTDHRGAGDRRGGLGLLLLDQWTDEPRDPVTLSGGETFVVSLALALGLADVVTAESGGRPIDTLFVDEGFGSLDADTLELVMDALDQLREGGRTVGLVSHVAEMRDRIPTRLEVVKARHGSTVRATTGVG